MLLGALFAVALLPAGAQAKRLALVVGNSSYDNVYSLENAANDAQSVAKSLKKLDFEVTLLTDGTFESLSAAIEEFSAKAETAESTLFYFAGHGFQLNGSNYLVPTDATLSSRDAISAETLQLNDIIDRLQSRDRQTLIFLDACRNNPLPASLQGADTGEGLAELQSGNGTFVAFATEPNNVTLDGAGDNSPFTKALVHHIATPGISISDMMIRVRVEVDEATLHKQTPWDQSSLREQFYFKPEQRKLAALDSESFEGLGDMTEDQKAAWLKFLQSDQGRAVFKNEEAAGLLIEDIEGAEAIEVALNLEPVEVLPDSTFVIEDVEDEPAVQVAEVGTVGTVEATATAPVVVAQVVTPAAVTPTGTEIATVGTVQAATPTAVVAATTTTPTAKPGATAATVVAETTRVVPTTEVASVAQTLAIDNVAASTAATSTTGNEDIAILQPAENLEAFASTRNTVIGREINPDAVRGDAIGGDSIRRQIEKTETAVLTGIEVNIVVEIPDDIATAAQQEMARLGCYRSRVDGDWGPASRRAAVRFYIGIKTPPVNADPTEDLYRLLVAQDKVVCELTVARSANTKAATAVAVKAGKRKIAPASQGGKTISKGLVGVFR